MSIVLISFEGGVAIGTFVLAVATFLSVYQVKKDRKIAIVKEKLSDFYAPLIGYASNKSEPQGENAESLYDIWINKWFLAEEGTLKAFPSSLLISSNRKSKAYQERFMSKI